MSKNMGVLDRTLRLLVVGVVVALYLTGQITGAIAAVLGVVALVFLATSLAGFCPLYVPLGLSTRRRVQSVPKS